MFTTNSDGGGTDTAIVDMDARTEALAAGVWTHIAMTHTPGRNTIYINGDSAHTVRAPGNLNPTSRPLVIGSDADGTGGKRFTGAIDDVRIYAEALTTAQVRALYQTLTALKEVNFTQVGKLYPNPATNRITFENSISDQAARYELNDMLGRTIGRGFVNSAREEIDLAGVPAGAYVLRVFGKEVQSSNKFFVE